MRVLTFLFLGFFLNQVHLVDQVRPQNQELQFNFGNGVDFSDQLGIPLNQNITFE